MLHIGCHLLHGEPNQLRAHLGVGLEGEIKQVHAQRTSEAAKLLCPITKWQYTPFVSHILRDPAGPIESAPLPPKISSVLLSIEPSTNSVSARSSATRATLLVQLLKLQLGHQIYHPPMQQWSIHTAIVYLLFQLRGAIVIPIVIHKLTQGRKVSLLFPDLPAYLRTCACFHARIGFSTADARRYAGSFFV